MKNKTNKLVIRLAFIIIGCINLSACSTHKVPPSLTINYITSSGMNPDINNNPSPVVVNIYELKNITVFMNIDYFTLADDPKKVLGDDLVEQSQIELCPNQKTTVTKNLNPDTIYVAVTAAYRTINKVQWRDYINLREHKGTTVVVNLGEDAVTAKLQ